MNKNVEELLVKKVEWSTETLIEQCRKGNIILSEITAVDTNKLEEFIKMYFNPYHIILYKIKGYVYGVIKGEEDIRTILTYDKDTSGNKDRFYSMPVTISFIENHIEDTESLKRLLK